MRRRVLCILAATAGLGMSLRAGTEAGVAGTPQPACWRGMVLGGVGSITLYHPDLREAWRLVDLCVGEIHRLEELFSLWRPDSQLSELNRRGVLVAPSADMVRVLRDAQRVAELTGGLFDVTVQPLWTLYRGHFSLADADPQGPPRAALEDALRLVGQDRLLVSRDRVAVAQRGMAITLNGIAQGYITDRIVERLRQAGVTRTLVDLGETRVVGKHPEDRPWRAALEDPETPGRFWGEVDLADRALATSGDGGFVFDRAGRFTHLLDPRHGRSPRRHRAVSVLAPEATLADGLSTAFALMPEPTIAATVHDLPDVEVRLLRHDGSSTSLRRT